MKNLSGKILTALAVIGLLFLSCDVSDTGNGTLLLRLPGSSARAAVSDNFANTLSYHIECSGPDAFEQFYNLGDVSRISLAEGIWTVTVTVYNAADQNIGYQTETGVVIESRKTTEVPIRINIDTSRCEITYFAITDPVNAVGEINQQGNTIAITVPDGTDVSSIGYSLTHTGVFINPTVSRLNFSSPQTFTVTAENGNIKNYTVTVTIEAEEPPLEEPEPEEPEPEEPEPEEPEPEEPEPEEPEPEEPEPEEPEPEDPPQGNTKTATINFTGFDEYHIDLTGDKTNDLRYGDTLILTINGEYDYVDQFISNGNYYNLYFNELDINKYELEINTYWPTFLKIGKNTITVILWKDDIPYSYDLIINVVW